MFYYISIEITKSNVTYAKVSDYRLNEVIKITTKFMYKVLENLQIAFIVGEWGVLGLARLGLSNSQLVLSNIL